MLLCTLNSFTVLVYPNYFEDDYSVFYFAVSKVTFSNCWITGRYFLESIQGHQLQLQVVCACTIVYDLLMNIEGYEHVSHYYILKHY